MEDLRRAERGENDQGQGHREDHVLGGQQTHDEVRGEHRQPGGFQQQEPDRPGEGGHGSAVGFTAGHCCTIPTALGAVALYSAAHARVTGGESEGHHDK